MDDLFDFDIDELVYLSGVSLGKMTTRQLRKYISRGLNFINEGAYFINDSSSISDSYDMLKEDLGTYRNKIVGRTSRARKAELIEKATDILVHLRTTAIEYGVSDEDIELRQQSEDAYKQLKITFKNPDMTRKQFEDIVTTFGALGDTVIEKYIASKEVYNVYNDVFKKGNSFARTNLQNIMVETYKEMESAVDENGNKIYGSIDKDKFTDKFVDLVLEKLKSYY